jgi:dTDP-3-amino-3,4,6-trideoxy-alpha-D-glucose transaminase
MTVAFLDPSATYRELQADLDAAYRRVMDSGTYVLGEEVDAFEAEFAAFCGAPHAVGVGNGLDALVIALRAAGVGPGDEVIVPAHTFIATWLAVARTGATIVPAEVDPDTLNLAPSAVEAAITPCTRALVPVHLYGHPADMDALDALAWQRELVVIEDAAQAHGARYRGRMAGMLGDAGCFSFYPGKNLGAFGDGGALTCAEPALAAAARSLRNYGSSAKYVHDELGDNSRLDPLQAAFLRVKLGRLAAWNARRAEIAGTYLRELDGVDELVLPAVRDDVEPAWHLFCVRHPRRDALQAHLAERGITTLVHYPQPPHLTGAFAHLGIGSGAFPVSEAAGATLLSLPIGPHLDDDAVARVVEAVRAF